MSKFKIQTEARERQGKTIVSGTVRYSFLGTPRKAEFRQGAEGLVQPVVNPDTGNRYRLKCFFDPSPRRRERSAILVEQKLANIQKNFADALGGAPFDLVENLGPFAPFGVVMKEIQGESWDRLKETARTDSKYPPSSWPSLQVRATWAYGLATAVKLMEANGFVHADIAHGNVMVTPSGNLAGSMALVDFDGFVHPQDPNLDNGCLGTAGYAAPEVNRSEANRLKVGTDRTGMAILIQEFLLYGDGDLNDVDSFLKGYDQEQDINLHRPIVHPLFEAKYPNMAELLKRTLASREPNGRPMPAEWRGQLYTLAGGKPPQVALVQVTLEGYPVAKPDLAINFPDGQKILDLSLTNYRMNVVLERGAQGTVEAFVQAGAKVMSKARSGLWTEVTGGTRIVVTPGLVLTQPSVRSGVTIRGIEKGGSFAGAAHA